MRMIGLIFGYILDSKENDDENVNEGDDNANEKNENVNNNNEQNGHDVVEERPVRQRKQPIRFKITSWPNWQRPKHLDHIHRR